MDQDPRTGPVEVNPPQTLQVAENDAPPPYAAFVVECNGRYYSVQEERGAKGEGANWNMKAFSMLYQLFQMTQQPMIASVPGIAIAK